MAIGENHNQTPQSWFLGRKALRLAGIHRPLQSGICQDEFGSGAAESIVLSGGFLDDEEHPDYILYTGEGGRDPNSKQQTTHQELKRGNLALKVSMDRGTPVRVSRKGTNGSLNYEYLGLWRVEDAWVQPSGHGTANVWRFKLVPFITEIIVHQDSNQARTPPKRVVQTVSRVVRDTAKGRLVKSLHNFTCQVCSTRIVTPTGPYAEAAHIHPLGKPHDGPDEIDNILCLCPNCHVIFDSGGFVIANDYTLVGQKGQLRMVAQHNLSQQCLDYRRDHYKS